MIAWIPVGLVGLAAGMTALNLATWPRSVRSARSTGRVSVLIPARNEELNLGACLDALRVQDHPLHEIIVYNDGSTDGTADIIAARMALDPRLRVVQGKPLPAGWVGKPHACHRLSQEATGDLLLYVDADVVMHPEGVGRLVCLLATHQAQVVTAVPGQVTGSFLERQVLPLLHLTYTSWLPLFLVHATHDPRFLAANGQILAVRRDAYDAIGGFEAVRTDVVDDMAFCRRAKLARRRVVFADGSTLAQCRMYRSAGEVWRGFSKNLYEGLGESPLALAMVLALYGGAFVLPYVLLLAAPFLPWLWLPALVGVGLNVVLRVALAIRFGHALESVVLHPLGVVVLLLIALNSWRWARSGRITWAGRTYARRAERGAR